MRTSSSHDGSSDAIAHLRPAARLSPRRKVTHARLNEAFPRGRGPQRHVRYALRVLRSMRDCTRRRVQGTDFPRSRQTVSTHFRCRFLSTRGDMNERSRGAAHRYRTTLPYPRRLSRDEYRATVTRCLFGLVIPDRYLARNYSRGSGALPFH